MARKKQATTHDIFLKKMSVSEQKKFKVEYREFILSELILAIMKKDEISVRKLATAAGVFSAVIQEIRSGVKENITMKTFCKILTAMGYSIVVERNDFRIPIGFPR